MDRVRRFLESISPNLALVAPFMFAFGAALYFGLEAEPLVAWPGVVAILCAACIIRIFILRGKFQAYNYVAIMLALFVLFGFFHAAFWARTAGTETMRRPWRDIMVQGRVSKIDYTSDRARVWLKGATTDKETPPMVMRITLSREDSAPDVGDVVAMRAALYRAGTPDAPGAFDFAKWSYFNGIGASGYAQENHRVISKTGGGAQNYFQDLRNKIHADIAAHASRNATMLADSLVLGHSRAMTRIEADNIRAAGLAHVFTISGLHMTLLGGWFFFIFNFIFKLFPPITRNFSSAKFAAVATWVCLAAYLMISGAGVATIRAFSMASLGFLAAILGRRAVSLRILCLCMFALLILRPHYALEAGFQMSFAAAFGLIYFFGGNREYEKRTRVQKLKRAVWLVLATSLISTIFTMPFVAHHFHAVALYGEIGNLLCLTIFSVVILPLTIFGTIASAFGSFWLLETAAKVYGFLYEIISFIAGMPSALLYVPSIPGWALALVALGGAFIILMKSRARWLGAAPIVLAVIYIFAKPEPVLYASRDREVVAVMTDSGNLRFNMPRSKENPFVFESWSGLNAEPFPERKMRKAFGKGFEGEKFSMECLKQSDTCIYKTKNFSVGIALRFTGLAKHLDQLCENTDFIITYDRVDYPNCKARIINEPAPFAIYPGGRVKFAPANRLWHNPRK
ncbi:MAG: ComEC family competence protein [Rickettsiales bacterium]|jgi:competence protein ComEC|nr:ComEC family competence protein [Rickettsiales bacterium]